MFKPRQTQANDRITAKVSRLRELLSSTEELEQVSDYFHDVLVLDEAFMACGVPASNARLLGTLQAVLEKVAPEGKLGTPLLTRIQQHLLCHGFTTWGQGYVVFLYFEQLDLGFCSYCPSSSSTEVTFLRFKLTGSPGVGTWGAWQGVGASARGGLQ